MGKIRYIWTDEDGNERVSKEPPINACRSMMGGNYTPPYKKAVFFEVEE
jgi:hypothetical protein